MGIDGGGVFKEFFTDLSKEVFDSDRGLWLANKKNELYPNHGSYATRREYLPTSPPFTEPKFHSP
jgi:ubiquitin-protein ligase E3 C